MLPAAESRAGLSFECVCADETRIRGQSFDSGQVLYNQGSCDVAVSLSPAPLSAF